MNELPRPLIIEHTHNINQFARDHIMGVDVVEINAMGRKLVSFRAGSYHHYSDFNLVWIIRGMDSVLYYHWSSNCSSSPSESLWDKVRVGEPPRAPDVTSSGPDPDSQTIPAQDRTLRNRGPKRPPEMDIEPDLDILLYLRGSEVTTEECKKLAAVFKEYEDQLKNDPVDGDVNGYFLEAFSAAANSGGRVILC
jgi:hypothetical protein